MRWLGATDIAIYLECDPDAIVTPGLCPCSEELQGQGVVLAFVMRGRRYSFCCDEFSVWEGNLYSILETLRVLRTIKQFHCSPDLEEYAGWCVGPAKAGKRSAAA